MCDIVIVEVNTMVKVDGYTAWQRRINGQPVSEIAKDLGVSRVWLWRIWKQQGLSREQLRVSVKCSWCNKPLERTPERAKNTMRHYCSKACYIEMVHYEGEGYTPWRQGQRIAKKVIEKHFDLKLGNVIHHVDKNNRHNEIENLWVFACTADHTSYHRGGKAKPIFMGGVDVST